MKNALPGRVRVGVFDIDLRTGELREGERGVILHDQSFRILCMLVECDGGLVSREEIRKKLWPNDTVVEFDHSINAAIKKLRQALGDSPDDPKYIETIRGKGYRLLVPVDRVAAAEIRPAHMADEAAGGDGTAIPAELQPAVLRGRTVSHYRVLDIIGGGGMGVVYRAEDLKLGRAVALKFLPEEMGSDPQMLERFSREARAASSLDHPNICSIYQFGEHEGRPFIVMQLLQGENLRDRLATAVASERRALPLPQLLDIGIQVSDGLQAAHEKGVIHRDIKPANIFLTDRGLCKILDFGLAKLLEESNEGEVAAQPEALTDALPSSSVATHLTRTGVAMGTAGYMSPEQVRGEKLDERTDLFSLGLVLYEMATGQRAFSGQTAATIYEAILNHPPVPARELNSELSPGLETVINRALEKDREHRYQHASELRIDLQRLRQSTEKRPEPPRSWRWLAIGLPACTLALCGWFLFHLLRLEPSKHWSLRQLTAISPDAIVLNSVSISPDGKYLAYAERAKGVTLLQIDTGESTTFPNSVSFNPLSWLPDGEHLFLSKTGETGTWKMSTVDGIPRKFLDESLYLQASPDGKRIAFLKDNALWFMNGDGSTPRKIASMESPWELGFFFVWSPNGHQIAYIRIIRSPSQAELRTCDLAGHCRTALSEVRLVRAFDTSDLLWLLDGRIIFSLGDVRPKIEGSNLWSLDVDPDTGRTRGKPKRLTDWTGVTQESLTASADGRRLAFQQGHSQTTLNIGELGANGRELGSVKTLDSDTWNINLAGWTHDSKSVLYAADRYDKWGIFLQKLNEKSPQVLVQSPTNLYPLEPMTITPDGQWLLYRDQRSVGSFRMMRIPLEGGSTNVLLDGRFACRCADAPSTLCVASHWDHQQLVFSVLDPLKGLGSELWSLETAGHNFANWDLSRDGENIALIDHASEGKILILSTKRKAQRIVSVSAWPRVWDVHWSADGKRLYLGGSQDIGRDIQNTALLTIDLAGRVTILSVLPSNSGVRFWPLPSPDGRLLLYGEVTWPSGIVILENF